MTHLFSILMLTLPLTFAVVGCGPNDNTGDADTDTGDKDFEATLRIVAPSGLSVDFLVDDEIVQTDSVECNYPVNQADTYEVALDPGEYWEVLEKEVEVTDGDDGATVEAPIWGSGEYGLAPCGTYEGESYGEVEVCADWANDQLVIDTNFLPKVVITGDLFLFDEDGVFVEGKISEDLSEIWIHESYDDSGYEHEETIYLQ